MSWRLLVLILGTCIPVAFTASVRGSFAPKVSIGGADKILNLAWPTKAPKASVSFKEAVVVTLHKLTPGVEGLLRQLARDINGTHRDLYALVDSKALARAAEVKKVTELVGGEEHVISLDYNKVEGLIFPDMSPKEHKLFDEFQGLHHSPAKPGAIWWLAEGPGSRKSYDFVWVVESDVRFEGNWSYVFDAYGEQCFDLVAVLDDPAHWDHWERCNHPGCRKPDRLRSFLPIFRLSKHLAEDVLETLRSGITGHHEALLYTICAEETRWKCTASNLQYTDLVGAIRFEKRDLPRRLKPMKLYHPVKSMATVKSVPH